MELENINGHKRIIRTLTIKELKDQINYLGSQIINHTSILICALKYHNEDEEDKQSINEQIKTIEYYMSVRNLYLDEALEKILDDDPDFIY